MPSQIIEFTLIWEETTCFWSFYGNNKSMIAR